ncbi:uncharacterized protein [Centruroides vittatus]|uniref:uncharacterized protein n=1 Tax=Centruroides vittatus TaxID=120091 RepID=UPI00350EF1FC
MPTCFVPGCKAGYKSSNEKRHFFRVPSDKIEKWMRCISRDDKKLTSKCYVCDVHFASRFILKTYSHVINGEKVEIPRDRWALTSDAYPSNFPNCPKYISKSVPQKRSTRCLTRNEEPSTKRYRKVNTKDLHDTHSQVTTVENEIEEPSTSEAATTQHPELLYVNKISALRSELLKVKEDLYRCRKQKMIYKKKLKTLQTENLKLHQENAELKIKQLSADKLDSLPPRQKLVIEHMLKACHIKSKKGMRYDINWLLDCLLLKIRSPSVYEFLRNNDYLPLPCQSTLHQYIRGINAKFGFDEDLFVILKSKLETIPQTECQGVLIFDEITLQKHIELSKATGEMIGLVDCGDNSVLPQSEFTAGDHGLVFMFRPHFASWVQCIGTFCSKSSVPGSTVAKLIL